VLVAFFQMLGLTLVAQPLNELLSMVFSYLPKLFAALVLALIAWIVATVLEKVILRVMQAACRLANQSPMLPESQFWSLPVQWPCGRWNLPTRSSTWPSAC
jgi:hypothetical protein